MEILFLDEYFILQVIVAGGAISGWPMAGSDSAEVYDRDEDSWRAIAALPHRLNY